MLAITTEVNPWLYYMRQFVVIVNLIHFSLTYDLVIHNASYKIKILLENNQNVVYLYYSLTAKILLKHLALKIFP